MWVIWKLASSTGPGPPLLQSLLGALMEDLATWPREGPKESEPMLKRVDQEAEGWRGPDSVRGPRGGRCLFTPGRAYLHGGGGGANNKKCRGVGKWKVL